MPWVWATEHVERIRPAEAGIGLALQREHPHLRPVAVAQHELMIGGQRGQGRGGLPDVPPLDHGVRPFVPLEQGVSAEGHYDAHHSCPGRRERGDHEGLDRVHPVLRLVEYH